MNITVVDSIMGSGKSTWVRNYMNNHPEKRWWYIAIRLSESNIPTTGCPDLNFQEPSDASRKKSDDLLSLIRRGANISSTHQLFLKINQTPEILDLIRSKGYNLVIDEVLDTVEDLSKENDDIQAQLAQGTFSINKETGKLEWLNGEYKGNDFKDVMKRCQTNDVYYNGTTLIALFKPAIFGVFQDIYVLTYMFNGSAMSMYCDFYHLTYTTKYISEGELTVDKPNNQAEKARIRELINIYDGPLYDIGLKYYTNSSLSQSWFKKPEHRNARERLFLNAYNYLHNIIKARSKNTMFTVFKTAIRRYPDPLPGYKKAFVECSAKATNDFRNRFNLVYMVNMFQDPEIQKFFSSHGVAGDEKAFARCTMVQWIWRSAIRDGRPINLFIPSQRMRRILINWLNHSD